VPLFVSSVVVVPLFGLFVPEVPAAPFCGVVEVVGGVVVASDAVVGSAGILSVESGMVSLPVCSSRDQSHATTNSAAANAVVATSIFDFAIGYLLCVPQQQPSPA
jgi:hypothetical protein